MMDLTRPTHLIGMHQPEIAGLAEGAGQTCALCLAEGLPGLPRERVLGDTFADRDYFQCNANWLCTYCLRALSYGRARTDFVQARSSLATARAFRVLQREELWAVLLNPPAEPFVLCVTWDHKKHMSFKARVNPGGSPFWVRSDQDAARFDLAALAPAIAVLQRWYTVCQTRATMEQSPTWFAKEDCLSGCRNTGRIAAYGLARYRAEDAILASWRGDHALDVLVYALSKTPKTEGTN